MKNMKMKAILAMVLAGALAFSTTASARGFHGGPGHYPPPHHSYHHHHGGGGDDLVAGACLGALAVFTLAAICDSSNQHSPSRVVEERTVTQTTYVTQPVVTQTTTTYAW